MAGPKRLSLLASASPARADDAHAAGALDERADGEPGAPPRRGVAVGGGEGGEGRRAPARRRQEEAPVREHRVRSEARGRGDGVERVEELGLRRRLRRRRGAAARRAEAPPGLRRRGLFVEARRRGARAGRGGRGLGGERGRRAPRDGAEVAGEPLRRRAALGDERAEGAEDVAAGRALGPRGRLPADLAGEAAARARVAAPRGHAVDGAALHGQRQRVAAVARRLRRRGAVAERADEAAQQLGVELVQRRALCRGVCDGLGQRDLLVRQLPADVQDGIRRRRRRLRKRLHRAGWPLAKSAAR